MNNSVYSTPPQHSDSQCGRSVPVRARLNPLHSFHIRFNLGGDLFGNKVFCAMAQCVKRLNVAPIRFILVISLIGSIAQLYRYT